MYQCCSYSPDVTRPAKQIDLWNGKPSKADRTAQNNQIINEKIPYSQENHKISPIHQELILFLNIFLITPWSSKRLY